MKRPDVEFIREIVKKCCYDCEGSNSGIRCIFRNSNGIACDLDRRAKKQIETFINKINERRLT